MSLQIDTDGARNMFEYSREERIQIIHKFNTDNQWSSDSYIENCDDGILQIIVDVINNNVDNIIDQFETLAMNEEKGVLANYFSKYYKLKKDYDNAHKYYEIGYNKKNTNSMIGYGYDHIIQANNIFIESAEQGSRIGIFNLFTTCNMQYYDMLYVRYGHLIENFITTKYNEIYELFEKSLKKNVTNIVLEAYVNSMKPLDQKIQFLTNLKDSLKDSSINNTIDNALDELEKELKIPISYDTNIDYVTKCQLGMLIRRNILDHLMNTEIKSIQIIHKDTQSPFACMYIPYINILQIFVGPNCKYGYYEDQWLLIDNTFYSNEEVISILLHELSHYLNDDFNMKMILVKLPYYITSNYKLTLGMLVCSKFIFGTSYQSNIIFAGSLILFNQLISYIMRKREIAADLNVKKLNNDSVKYQISSFEKVKQNEDSPQSIFTKINNFINLIWCGDKHPSTDKRIEILKKNH